MAAADADAAVARLLEKKRLEQVKKKTPPHAREAAGSVAKVKRSASSDGVGGSSKDGSRMGSKAPSRQDSKSGAPSRSASAGSVGGKARAKKNSEVVDI